MNSSVPFWEKPLATLDRGEWDALSDGCGRCCLHKLEDEETGLLYPTNVACKLLDHGANADHTDAVAGYSARDYANRNSRAREIQKLINDKKPKSASAAN
jgi:uncharacterized cysteine cluster protein YcgN (CxxCxxCC family)